MQKIAKLINYLLIVNGILLAIEGVFSFVAGAHIPFVEFLVQLFLSAALITAGAKEMVEL